MESRQRRKWAASLSSFVNKSLALITPGRPLDTHVVIVVDGDAVVGVRYAEVDGLVADMFEFCHAFAGGNDFSFAGAE
eukprot:scaffold5353_cov40-Cyclotella_meneghiniana.AAC.1